MDALKIKKKKKGKSKDIVNDDDNNVQFSF